ncbi:MAG: hypothetical protein PHN48_09135, partial [Parabacteroides sp.]|nr:hypothetical protein [Parabacteroides sp.]
WSVTDTKFAVVQTLESVGLGVYTDELRGISKNCFISCLSEQEKQSNIARGNSNNRFLFILYNLSLIIYSNREGWILF